MYVDYCQAPCVFFSCFGLIHNLLLVFFHFLNKRYKLPASSRYGDDVFKENKQLFGSLGEISWCLIEPTQTFHVQFLYVLLGTFDSSSKLRTLKQSQSIRILCLSRHKSVIQFKVQHNFYVLRFGKMLPGKAVILSFGRSFSVVIMFWKSISSLIVVKVYIMKVKFLKKNINLIAFVRFACVGFSHGVIN